MTQPTPARTKTTIFKETLPPEDRSSTDAQPSAFYARDWETVMAELTPEQWKEHKVRVYRADEKWDRSSSPVDNVFTAAFGEEDLRARFGGGRYILWLLGPPKQHNLVGKYQVTLDGQPILNGTPRAGTPGDPNTVALEAMRMYANPEFVRMQMQMMVTAATEAMALIKSQMPVAQNPLETLKTAKEILGAGEPKDNLLDTIRVLKELGIVGSPEKKGIDEILSLINTLKTSGLIPSGAPKADLGSTFAANLPMLVDRAVAGLHEFRLRAEAEERVIRLQRGEIRPNDPNVITVENQNSSAQAAPSPTSGTLPASTAQTSTSVTPEVAQAIIAQSHLHRLVAGVKQSNSTGQDMYDYLVNAWPEVLGELEKMSKETLLAFFKNREMQKTYFGSDILAEVGDDPRLPKMLEDFLRIAKESSQPEPAAASAVASSQVV